MKGGCDEMGQVPGFSAETSRSPNDGFTDCSEKIEIENFLLLNSSQLLIHISFNIIVFTEIGVYISYI